MKGKFPIGILFYQDVVSNTTHCIDFTSELRGSLNLFGTGFLADYFPHFVALISAFTVYTIFQKAFPKPRKILAILSLPVVFIATFKLTTIVIENYLSYCL